MPPETNNLQQAFAELPPMVQEALRAMDLRKRFDQIREKNHLHIDQAGVLENETVYTMLGINDPDAYGPTLQKELNLPNDQLRSLLLDVNELIFLPIRQAMERSSEPAPQAAFISEPAAVQQVPQVAQTPKQTSTAEILTKEQILAEIENPEKLLPPPPAIAPLPTPATPPKSAAHTMVAQPAPQPPAPTKPAETPASPFLTPTPAAPVAAAPKDLLEQKLGAPTRLPPQEINLSPKPSTRSVDPYREPV